MGANHCVCVVVTMKNKHSKKISRQVSPMLLYQLSSRRHPYLQQLSFPQLLYLYPSSCGGAKVRPQNCITFTISAGLSFPSQVHGWEKDRWGCFQTNLPVPQYSEQLLSHLACHRIIPYLILIHQNSNTVQYCHYWLQEKISFFFFPTVWVWIKPAFSKQIH